jgi:hypothetical protein
MAPMEWPPQPPPVPPGEEEEKNSPEIRIENEPAGASLEAIENQPGHERNNVKSAGDFVTHEEKTVEESKEGTASREAVQAKTTVVASAEMLELLMQNDGVSDQHKETLARLADHIRTHHTNPSAEDARQVAVAVVGAVNVMLVDNIKQANKTPFYQQEFQEIYRREKAAESYVRKITASEVVYGERAKIGEERLTIVTANEEELVNNKLQEVLSERESQVENGPNAQKVSYERVPNMDEMVEKIPNDTSDQERIIYLNHPVSAEEMMKVKEKLESSSEENITNTLVCLRVRLNETMSGFYFLGSPTLARSIGGHVEQRGAKKSILPTQDKWLAFLENGLVPPMNYFPDTRDPIIKKATLDSLSREGVPVVGNSAGTEAPDDIGEFVSSMLKEEDLQRWQEYSRRKLDVFVRAEDPEAAERYLNRTREHYEFFFERNGTRPDVVLTRGGFSANETAINAISNLASEGERKAYILPGWYYENQHAIEDKLDVVGSADEANILFLNSSPNGFVEDADLAKNYAQRRDQLAKELIRRAAGSPDKKFFLVVDKTTDLLYESFTDISDLPDNLIVMETSSITKNQRGGRNYFYGTVACWSKESQRGVLDEAVVSARGELTPLAVVNFPRLRRSEVKQRQEKLLDLEKSFQEAFEEAQVSLPPENRWRLQRNSGFCALLVPPFEALLKITKDRMELGRLVSEEALTERAKFFTSELIPLGVEIGDSFGLDETRLTAINLKLPESYGVTLSDRSRRKAGPRGAKELETLGFNRIAFGYGNTSEQARKIGEVLGKKLIENFPPEMFEANG